jgi:hypothetical protein
MFSSFSLNSALCGYTGPICIFFFGGITAVETRLGKATSTVAAAAWERAFCRHELDQRAGEKEEVGKVGEK